MTLTHLHQRQVGVAQYTRCQHVRDKLIRVNLQRAMHIQRLNEGQRCLLHKGKMRTRQSNPGTKRWRESRRIICTNNYYCAVP